MADIAYYLQQVPSPCLQARSGVGLLTSGAEAPSGRRAHWRFSSDVARNTVPAGRHRRHTDARRWPGSGCTLAPTCEAVVGGRPPLAFVPSYGFLDAGRQLFSKPQQPSGPQQEQKRVGRSIRSCSDSGVTAEPGAGSAGPRADMATLSMVPQLRPAMPPSDPVFDASVGPSIGREANDGAVSPSR